MTSSKTSDSNGAKPKGELYQEKPGGNFKKGNPGGGRPKQKSLRDLLSVEQEEELVKLAVEKAKKDPSMSRFVLEQIFGKARQNIGLDGGEEDKPINLILNKIENENRQTLSKQKLQDK